MSPIKEKYITQAIYIILLYISGVDLHQVKKMSIELAKNIRIIFREDFE